MKDIIKKAEAVQKEAFRVIAECRVRECWQGIGAQINLVGSLKTGLLMKHLDIDFHIYTPELNVADSFRAMAGIAQNARIRRIEYADLRAAEDNCLEWHAWYETSGGRLWQIDMMHIARGSVYDGYFEETAERILAVMTAEQKKTILELKWQTPDAVKIPGIEYYMAVIRDGVKDYRQFEMWRKQNPQEGIIAWRP